MEIEPKEQKNKLFELKSWTAVAVWSWNIEVDQCAIDRKNLNEPCIVNFSLRNAT